MSKCKDTSKTSSGGGCIPDFKNPSSIINSILCLFKIPPMAGFSGVPTPLILASKARCAGGGLNASVIAAKIIKRQAEAGIPVGPLPSGIISPDEIMEKIRVEEIVGAITTKMVLDVAIRPGIAIQGQSLTLPSIPVQGSTISMGVGQAVVNPCA